MNSKSLLDYMNTQELLLYLLQLVQALKYENADDIMAAHDKEQDQMSSPNAPPVTPFVGRRHHSGNRNDDIDIVLQGDFTAEDRFPF